ncbi:MAG: glycine cleavage system aminomethyltransferase GcvT [Acidimicrobiia bacterium]
MTQSPLHRLHQSLGARFVDFGGWEMPVQYASVLAEHRAVRTAAGWFDVSHLGRFELTGPGAFDALRHLLCNDVAVIEPGRTQYTMMLNSEGGIVDDLIVWWLDDDRFWVLPNAANHTRVMQVFEGEPGCRVADLRPSTVMIAVQGPLAPDVLEEVLGQKPRRHRVDRIEWSGESLAVAGTGYTGERGGEICADALTGERLLEELMARNVDPCGLAARDTLRLEAGLALWGADIDETTTPLEADLEFVVSMDHEFNGREALQGQVRLGVGRRLSGFVLDQKGIPRHGYQVRSGLSTGVVTSGNLSPMLDKGIGLAYFSPPVDEGAVEVEIREKWVGGHLARPPFHRDG